MPTKIAVIDVETTGFSPKHNDRVLELAAVIVDPEHGVVSEFSTLVNPCRDVGPTRIHRLTAEDVLHAPRFDEIAGAVVEAMDGTIALAAHNARFDKQFLYAEFERSQQPLADCPWLCTMQLAGGGKLTACCSAYGIAVGECEAHSALHDARLAAQLLLKVLNDDPKLIRTITCHNPIAWPKFPKPTKQPLTRSRSRELSSEPQTYIKHLLARASDALIPCTDDGAILAYASLLSDVLEDRIIDDQETAMLLELAAEWGLSHMQIVGIHDEYIRQLAICALRDGIVTEAEKSDLRLVARLLGRPELEIDRALTEASNYLRTTEPTPPSSLDSGLAGKRVCFTGELNTILDGKPVTRDIAEMLASNAGLVVTGSVTKKLDILVVADPNTQSGKAVKARNYGVRIMQEQAFWNAIGVDLH